jgi:hypothetical protein
MHRALHHPIDTLGREMSLAVESDYPNLMKQWHARAVPDNRRLASVLIRSAIIVPIIASGTILGAGSASFAKDAGPPTIDIQRTCRENIAALRSVLGTSIQQDMDACKNDEEDARQQLVREWGAYPALARSRCVKSNEYLPGYVEWLVCIQMTQDALKSRGQQTAPATVGSSDSRSSPRRRTAAGTRVCPAIQYAQDGSIDYIINC